MVNPKGAPRKYPITGKRGSSNEIRILEVPEYLTKLAQAGLATPLSKKEVRQLDQNAALAMDDNPNQSKNLEDDIASKMDQKSGVGLDLPGPYDLAAEPWVGPFPMRTRLEFALNRLPPAAQNEARSALEEKCGLSSNDISRSLTGRRKMNQKILSAFFKELCPKLDVHPIWIIRGTHGSITKAGIDYFTYTPIWLHKELETLLKTLGHPQAYLLGLEMKILRLQNRIVALSKNRRMKYNRRLVKNGEVLLLGPRMYDGTQDPLYISLGEMSR